MTRPTAAEVIARHADRILAMPGVVGMAEGLFHNKPCIQIHMAGYGHSLRKSLPVDLDGYPVITIVTGEAELL